MSTEATLGLTPAASSHVAAVWRHSCGPMGVSFAAAWVSRRAPRRVDGPAERLARGSGGHARALHLRGVVQGLPRCSCEPPSLRRSSPRRPVSRAGWGRVLGDPFHGVVAGARRRPTGRRPRRRRHAAAARAAYGGSAGCRCARSSRDLNRLGSGHGNRPAARSRARLGRRWRNGDRDARPGADRPADPVHPETPARSPVGRPCGLRPQRRAGSAEATVPAPARTGASRASNAVPSTRRLRATTSPPLGSATDHEGRRAARSSPWIGAVCCCSCTDAGARAGTIRPTGRGSSVIPARCALDVVGQVRGRWAAERFARDQADVRAHAVKQPGAGAQHHRHEVEADTRVEKRGR
jgi:hypothetical protein